MGDEEASAVLRTTYPVVGLEKSRALARTIRHAGGTATVEATAAALGLSMGTANFKYQVLAARLFGLVRRRGNELELTELGVRLCEPDADSSDLRQVLDNVPAFAAVRKGPKGPQDTSADILLAAGVPGNRLDRVHKIYLAITAELRSRGPAAGAPGASEDVPGPVSDAVGPVPRSPATVRGVCRPMESAGPVPHLEPAPAGGSTADALDGRDWLLSDPALRTFLRRVPPGDRSWSEERRENFIVGVGSILRELIWAPGDVGS